MDSWEAEAALADSDIGTWRTHCLKGFFDQCFHNSEKTDFINSYLTPLVSSCFFHLFPDFHTEEFMNVLLQHCKRCSVLYLYFAFWNMSFIIVLSPCEFTKQECAPMATGSPCCPVTGSLRLTWVCLLLSLLNILQCFEMHIFVLNSREQINNM